MLSFARIGCRIFVVVVNLVVTVDQFLDFVDPYLHQEMVLDLPLGHWTGAHGGGQG